MSERIAGMWNARRRRIDNDVLVGLFGDTDRARAWMLERVDRSGQCWKWTGYKNKGGYGIACVRDSSWLAHRISYAIFVGPLELTIDHLCKQHDCINPAHLDQVTDTVNYERGNAPPRLNSAKTHCKRGHPLSGENLKRANGRRACKICDRKVGTVRREVSPEGGVLVHCDYCKTPFTQYRKDNLFCSDNCIKKKHYWDNREAALARKRELWARRKQFMEVSK